MTEKAYKISEGNQIYTQFQNYVEDRKKLKQALKKIADETGIKDYVGLGNFIVSVKKEQLTEETLALYESSIKNKDKNYEGFYKIRSNSKLDKYIEATKKEFGYKGYWFDVVYFFDLAGKGEYIRSIITPEDVKSEEKCFWLKIQLVNGGIIKLNEEYIDKNLEEIKLSEWYLLLEKNKESKND